MNNKKKSILIFLNAYKPGYKCGGPIQTIYNLVNRLNDKIDFKILCRNKDFDKEPPYENIEYNQWIETYGATVTYLSDDNLNIANYYKYLKESEYDYVYLNSFFNFYFSILPLITIKLFLKKRFNVILAPRGEFSTNALKISSFKKKLYILFSKVFQLHKEITWQATASFEKADIINRLNVPEKNIHVISNLPCIPKSFKSDHFDDLFKDEVLKIIFLARVTKIKNLKLVLEVLRKIECPVKFDIVGIIDDEKYWAECQKMIEFLPSHITVEYKGSVEHEKVLSILQQYHLYFFPTFGENFGHSIFESFCSGTPVLISDQTPWVKLEEKGVGWDLSLTKKESFINAINEFNQMTREEKIDQRRRAFEYAIKKSQNSQDILDNYKLFNV